jgi:hypothetical protein
LQKWSKHVSDNELVQKSENVAAVTDTSKDVFLRGTKPGGGTIARVSEEVLRSTSSDSTVVCFATTDYQDPSKASGNVSLLIHNSLSEQPNKLKVQSHFCEEPNSASKRLAYDVNKQNIPAQ